MNLTEILGFVAGSFTSVSTLPQLIKTLRKKEAGDVSITMFLVLITGIALWVAYGLQKKDMPVVITNSLALLLNIMMLILKIRYGKRG